MITLTHEMGRTCHASWRRQFVPFAFLAPALVMFTACVLYPIADSLWLSLYDWDGLGPKTFIGLANYIELFDDDAFYTALVNNLLWLLFFLLAPPLGLGLALLLNQTVTGIRLYKSLFFFPFVLSQIVVGIVFSWFYAPDFGLLTALIKTLAGAQTAILADERFATYGIIAAGLWPQIAYCMILYLTGLNNINPELIEAGRMDGARGCRLFWHVVLPQLGPATFIAVVVTIIGSLRSFDLVSIMTAGGPYGSTRVLSFYMYEQALSEFGYRMGYGAAIAAVLFAIMMVFISLFILHMFKKERAG